MSDAILTLSEVADELRISPEAARKLTISGRLPFVSVGCGQQRHTRRVRRDDLEAFKRGERRASMNRAMADAREFVQQAGRW